MSLFDEIGGTAAVDAAVDIFYRNVLMDDTISHFFDDIDMDEQRAKQKLFLTMAFGGPAGYSGQDLREGHAGRVERGLNENHFAAVAGHLNDSLEELKVSKSLILQVMHIAASTKNDILNR